MPKPRREFFRDLLAIGALQGLAVSPPAVRRMSAFFDEAAAQAMNPDFDAKAFNFWSGFLSKNASPVTRSTSQTRGGRPGAESSADPVFLHYDTDGFKYAAELDSSKLIPSGDVSVSLNTSTIKICPEDQKTFDRLQNAQIRVDVAQKNSILPVIEAMAYTVVSGMLSVRQELNPKLPKPPAVQNVSVASDPTWQKMQNIILPGGGGRWALNLEAQKKDSLFCKVLQNIVKEAPLFAPMIGLPGIAMSALQSFNVLYGAIHAEPVQIMKTNPVSIYATQDAVQKTGAPGSVSGIMMKTGQYILMPASQAPRPDQMTNLAVIQDRIVPQNTKLPDLEQAAAETLKDVTYITFDVQVQSASLFPGAPGKSA